MRKQGVCVCGGGLPEAEEEATQEAQEHQLRIVPVLTPSCKLGQQQWRPGHRRQPGRRLWPPVRQLRHPHMRHLSFIALCILLSHNCCQPPPSDVPPAIPRGRKRKAQVSIVLYILLYMALGINFFFQALDKDLEVPVPESIRTRSRSPSTLRSEKF